MEETQMPIIRQEARNNKLMLDCANLTETACTVFDGDWSLGQWGGSLVFYNNFHSEKYVKISPSLDDLSKGEVRYSANLRVNEIPVGIYAMAVADRLNQLGNNFDVVEEAR